MKQTRCEFVADGYVATGQLLECTGITKDDMMICRGYDVWIPHGPGRTNFGPIGLCCDHTFDGEVGVAVVKGRVIFGAGRVADMEVIGDDPREEE